ncbi:hypothetical protein phiSHEF5_36 [Enterococcus phage phiSHEF5]|uniref:Uncharacterized protein n=2 Tax=Efquatrovirus TaxID=2560124 RepID=A0A249XUS9_9CAUD|nr:hypothetical protein FDI50_gp36 [Enterococcus phage phiSHEF5]ASZ75692.1 hypothetical protein phiSHEF5_36 [Enterococcus phage phiSHEF5]
MIQLKNEKNGEWQKMNNTYMFRKLFPNGWLIDVKHNPNGFGDMYSTNYNYSVMMQHVPSGFVRFENIETAQEVFQLIAKYAK